MYISNERSTIPLPHELLYGQAGRKRFRALFLLLINQSLYRDIEWQKQQQSLKHSFIRRCFPSCRYLFISPSVSRIYPTVKKKKPTRNRLVCVHFWFVPHFLQLRQIHSGRRSKPRTSINALQFCVQAFHLFHPFLWQQYSRWHDLMGYSCHEMILQ